MDRRAFVRSGLGTIVAIGATAIPVAAMARPAAPRTAWDVAMAEYVAAKAAMDAIDGDEVVGRFIKAEKAMLDTRTPDMRALRWKMERMRDISDCSVIEPKDFDQLLADITRLLGDA